LHAKGIVGFEVEVKNRRGFLDLVIDMSNGSSRSSVTNGSSGSNVSNATAPSGLTFRLRKFFLWKKSHPLRF
jgi:hypothetical protein